jgi:hypothetical protein
LAKAVLMERTWLTHQVLDIFFKLLTTISVAEGSYSFKVLNAESI